MNNRQKKPPGPSRRNARHSSRIKWLIAGLVVLILAAGLIEALQISKTSARSIQLATRNCNALADLLHKTLTTTFEKTDLTVSSIADEVVRQAASGGIRPETLRSFIDRQFRRMPELEALRISDAGGNVTMGSGIVATVPTNISDRDYFNYLRTHADAGMFISKPIIGRTSQKLLLTCARRITLNDGSFGGVVFGAITIETFIELFSKVPIGQHGSVTFVTEDLTLVTRYSPGNAAKPPEPGGRLTVSETFKKILQEGSSEVGSYRAVSGADGIKRIYSYHRLSPHPMYVNVGLAEDDVLAELRGEQSVFIRFYLLLFILLGILIYGLYKNISQRARLQGLIENAATEWQKTFDSISDSIALINPDQRIIRCNSATSVILGREFTEIIDQPCWKLFHGTDAPISDCPMSRAKLSLHSETSTIKHLDRWLEVTVDPILSDSGELTGAVHIVRDVTGTRNLVNDIRNVNELFRMFMKYSPIYCFIKEISGNDSRVLQVSQNYVNMTGIRSEDMIGKTMHELFPPEFADKITADDMRVLDLKEVLCVEEHFNSGTYITYKFPITLDDGKNLLAGYTIDISERKKTEETVRDMQAQLMQQEKLATIGQLAAGVAHEINNPMGFVGSNMITLKKYVDKYDSYIDRLEQEIRSASAGELPEAISELRRTLKLDYMMRDIHILVEENIEGLDRVRHIVHDLIVFSRADSSITGSVDLNSCLESTVNIVINEIRYAAELKREYGELPKVYCNVQQINQVFMNLLINAFHAVQNKGEELGEIVVRTWCEQDNVFVSVSDTGCGIAPENLGRIFDAFYTTKEVGKGTGLGLSISMGIVHKHGGEISVKSEAGVGSTFTVRLPLKPSDQVDTDRRD